MDNLNHIAFIMDGNGRWAKQQNKPRTFGHEKGINQILEIIDGCITNKIKYISFFAFSTENWKRPQTEVNAIFDLFKKFLNEENLQQFHKHKARLNVIGFDNPTIRRRVNNLDDFVNQTKHNENFIINIFLNYGSQQEIVNACNLAIENGKKISLKQFEKLLLTKQLPSVDLLIRTSGEKRISNFMLWQIAYAEIIFVDTYWPAYNKINLQSNIDEYYQRIRRYGGL